MKITGNNPKEIVENLIEGVNSETGLVSILCPLLIINDGFGHRCKRCGSFFDEGGICAQHHCLGEIVGLACAICKKKLDENKNCPGCEIIYQ